MFFVMVLPELMINTFIPKAKTQKFEQVHKDADQAMTQESGKKRDKKFINGKKKRQASTQNGVINGDFDESGANSHKNQSITLENRAFIIKYLLLFPSIYAKLPNQKEVTVDIPALVNLISCVFAEKLLVKILTLMVVALKDTGKVIELVQGYVKQTIMEYPQCIDVVLHALVALVYHSDVEIKLVHKIMAELGAIGSKILHNKFTHMTHDFAKNTCRKYKQKMHKASSEVSEKVVEEIVSENYLKVVKFIMSITQDYQPILDLLSATLSFMGPEITIFTPFTIQVIRLYHRALFTYCERLAERDTTCATTIASFVALMLESNDSFFCKNQDKVNKDKKKNPKGKLNLNSVKLTHEELSKPELVNKYFQELLNSLKIAMALYYNKGRNIGFPDFSITIVTRLRK